MTGGDFLTEVAAGLTVIVLVALAGGGWQQRDRIRRLPTTIKEARQRRQAARDAKAHEKLVDRVFERAEATGTTVPRKVRRKGSFVTVTYWPGDEVWYFVPDFNDYQQMVASVELSHQRMRRGAGPDRAVQDWSAEELRTWLADHPAPRSSST